MGYPIPSKIPGSAPVKTFVTSSYRPWYWYIDCSSGRSIPSSGGFQEVDLMNSLVSSFCSTQFVSRVNWSTTVTFTFCSLSPNVTNIDLDILIGGSRGGREGRTPPLGVQILSISCSFRENLACSRPPWRVHAPPLGKILDPPLILMLWWPLIS